MPNKSNFSTLEALMPMVCSNKSWTMDLPEEIVADILSRLPIKTIVQCNSVCKRWHNILLESYFVQLHLSRSPTCLLIHNRNRSSMPEDLCFQLAELDDKSDIYDINHHPQIRLELRRLGSENDYRLIGSVNGLICLSKWYRPRPIYICNPVTQECMHLPVHIKGISKSYAFETHGFGFVEASNEYKIVCFYQDDLPKLGGEVYSGCKVYTLGSGMWRSLGHVPFLVYGGKKGLFLGNIRWFGSRNAIFVNSNLHWLVYHQKNGTINGRVCTFDLKKEVFQLTALPEVGGSVTRRSLELLGGCLCVCDKMSNSELAIWVMKDYGMKESWSKEIIIRDNLKDILIGTVSPIKVLKDGTILLFCESSLLTYQPRSENLQTLNISSSGAHNAIIYVPSFIRLKSFMAEKVSVL